SVIELSSSQSESASSSSSSSDGEEAGGSGGARKKKKRYEGDKFGVVLPPGFLDPLPSKQKQVMAVSCSESSFALAAVSDRQFWKAGDFDDSSGGDWSYSGGMDHVRVHPRFLHSNATSHKWVLGAFAELLDNALDEIRNGATYVAVDMVQNMKDDSKMLLIEDNGGGMSPDKMRHCMSLGYSAKSKMANTIGQYGNGFKTSTMRLGADVIVFSRCRGVDGERPTQTIGMLSYTFLRSTRKEDIVVPMLDYEKRGQAWSKIMKSTAGDWENNVDAIVNWSPFTSEENLLQQFDHVKNQGTRIIIYNLWEDEEGQLELDFDANEHDIQIRGVNRDDKSIEMAQRFPNSRHFLTYRHSLRSYAAILYLRIPPQFRITLRGKDVAHHNIVSDMMMSQEITYRPQPGSEGIPKSSNMVAVVTVGFVKDAKAHIDVQGFNVYHKNRLIKPFWRVWHPPGSDGRGVIGVLEANFVEPAHDKQGFERTTILARLESRLIQMQKSYWTTNCHKIGYAPRCSKKDLTNGNVSTVSSFSDFFADNTSFFLSVDSPFETSTTRARAANKGRAKTADLPASVRDKVSKKSGKDDTTTPRKRPSSAARLAVDGSGSSDEDRESNSGGSRPSPSAAAPRVKKSEASEKRRVSPASTPPAFNDDEPSPLNPHSNALARIEEENQLLKLRLQKKEEEILGDVLVDLQSEKEKCESLETQLELATRKYEELSKEQECLINLFSEERKRRDADEALLRDKIKEASSTIEELLKKIRMLERKNS
ncbi:hypothetical protein M569_00153, partial [Genlisea aurea]